jgi:hypothetical protein
MKHITKLAFLGAIIAAFGATVALADDAQLQNRLAMQRAQNPSTVRSSTIAVYSNRQGVTRTTQDERSDVARFEIRTNAHGQTFAAYAPAQ